jgi:excisionase family DNA binding protein
MAKTALDLICTPDEAAKQLGLTPERVLQFCRAGRLQARKMGRDWVILSASVRMFAKSPRPEGRPVIQK